MRLGMDESSFLIRKVESIETRLENHVTKIELKLDQIVEIMREVATLQEKESRNAEDILEVKSSLKEVVEGFNRTIERVHARLDTIDNKHDEIERDFSKRVDEVKKAKEESCSIVDSKIRKTDEKVNTWLNRGIGAWIAASILLLVIQGIGGIVIKSIQEDFQSMQVKIMESQKRDIEFEKTLSTLRQEMSSYHKGK